MTKWKRLKTKLYLFFRADLPMFWEERSLFTKVSFGCLGVILGQMLIVAVLVAHAIGFMGIMSLFHNNKTYPLLRSAEEITSISIVQFSKEFVSYGYKSEETPKLLMQSTTATLSLDQNQMAQCVAALEDLPAHRWWNDPSPSMDVTALQILYRDGSVEWISCEGSFQYSPGENYFRWTRYFFEEEEFYQFLQQFGYEPSP